MPKPPYELPLSTSLSMERTFSLAESDLSLARPRFIPIDLIEFDENNPRKLALTRKDLPKGPNKNDPLYEKKRKEYEEDILPIAESIKELGLMTPIHVFVHGEKYKLIYGECRCLASIILGETKIKAFILKEKNQAQTQPENEYKRILMRHAENNIRKNLNLYEKLAELKVMYEAFKEKICKEAKLNTAFVQGIYKCSERKARDMAAILNGPSIVMELINNQNIKNLKTAAIIATTKDKNIQDQLIKTSREIKGISTTQLNKILNKAVAIKGAKKLIKKRGNINTCGVKATRVNMGHTKNTRVIKEICELVIDHEKYSSFKSEFIQTNWDEISDCTNAFKKIIKLMESIETN